jgi:hypothetical protein
MSKRFFCGASGAWEQEWRRIKVRFASACDLSIAPRKESTKTKPHEREAYGDSIDRGEDLGKRRQVGWVVWYARAVPHKIVW